MSDAEVDEKAKWAFGALWKKLHFGHISRNDSAKCSSKRI